MPHPKKQELAGQWFDGRTSRARPVVARPTAGRAGAGLELHARDTGETLSLAAGQIRWPEQWSGSPRRAHVLVDLGDHGSLQLEDPSAWQAALAQAGRRPPLSERMQTRLKVFVPALIVAVLAVWSFYRWGTPWAATQLARHVPLSWEQSVSAKAMAEIDAAMVKPSQLSPERQQALRNGFSRLSELVRAHPELQAYRGYLPPLQLEFRSGMPPNAFALPGGLVVMTDAMVQHARDHASKLELGLGHTQNTDGAEAALLGVLAHEIGHVQHRHTTRMLVEQGVLNIGLGLALGDVSSMISFSSSLLTGLAYRRQHETEADCYAVALMQKAGLPSQPMADLLLSIEQGVREKSESDETAPRTSAGWNWLSTHPDTAERARNLCPGQ